MASYVQTLIWRLKDLKQKKMKMKEPVRWPLKVQEMIDGEIPNSRLKIQERKCVKGKKVLAGRRRTQ